MRASFYFQGKHNWGNLNDSKGTKTCPMCLGGSGVAQLCMGAEPGKKTTYISNFSQGIMPLKPAMGIKYVKNCRYISSDYRFLRRLSSS